MNNKNIDDKYKINDDDYKIIDEELRKDSNEYKDSFDYKKISDSKNKKIIAEGYQYFTGTAIGCFIGAGVLTFESLNALFMTGGFNGVPITIPLFLLSLICALVVIPFIVKHYDKKRPVNVISFDKEKQIFEVFMNKDDYVLGRIPLHKVSDVEVNERRYRYRGYYYGGSNCGGTITFILKDGRAVESIKVKRCKEVWKKIQKMVIEYQNREKLKEGYIAEEK